MSVVGVVDYGYGSGWAAGDVLEAETAAADGVVSE